MLRTIDEEINVYYIHMCLQDHPVLVNQNFRRNQTIADFLLYLSLKLCLIGWLLKFILFPFMHFYC